MLFVFEQEKQEDNHKHSRTYIISAPKMAISNHLLKRYYDVVVRFGEETFSSFQMGMNSKPALTFTEQKKKLKSFDWIKRKPRGVGEYQYKKISLSGTEVPG